MFKTLTVVAGLQLASATFNSDFISGAQTGIFIKDEEQFLDYSCPEPEMTEQVEKYFNMYNTAKTMMGGMNPKNKKSKKHVEADEEESFMVKLFADIDMYAEQAGVIMSVMNPEYEGGDFCQGLTVAYEGRNVLQKVATSVVKTLFADHSAPTAIDFDNDN